MFKFSIRDLIWLMIATGLGCVIVRNRVDILKLKNKLEAEKVNLIEVQLLLDESNDAIEEQNHKIQFLEKLLEPRA